MILIGEFNTLEILRHTSVGLFLGDTEGNDVLLPNKYVPEEYEIGDKLKVYCYLDHEERIVATSLTPYILLNDFALLRVDQVNKFGAYLDWGLEKQLFVPFKEQAVEMVEGNWYLVYLYLDDKTNRLVGSSKFNKFLKLADEDIKNFDELAIIVSRFIDLGVEVIINKKYKGVVYKDEIFQDLVIGQELKGVIKKVRPDGKIDVSLQQLGYKNIEPSSQKILDVLKDYEGFLPLHDKSDPEEIKETLEMSKKAFKKAIGNLYKQKMIAIKDDGIHLL
ncbi:S1 RNA-binding domain-containing protein [Zhouia sp. PK063]|uniref:S1 RNA-binding domain-containing protein n=1 Tax=Zhouia sp. PK063 TaxID=3373602 RepID=UPI0037BA5930